MEKNTQSAHRSSPGWLTGKNIFKGQNFLTQTPTTLKIPLFQTATAVWIHSFIKPTTSNNTVIQTSFEGPAASEVARSD